MTYAKAIDEKRRDAIRNLEEFRRSHKVDSSEVWHPGVVQEGFLSLSIASANARTVDGETL